MALHYTFQLGVDILYFLHGIILVLSTVIRKIILVMSSSPMPYTHELFNKREKKNSQLKSVGFPE